MTISKPPVKFCKFCKATDFVEHQIKEMMYGSGEQFVYLECKSCHSLQIDDVPADISKYYGRDYYTRLNADNFLRRWILKQRNKSAYGHSSIIGRILNDWVPAGSVASVASINLAKNLRIVDIGCGSGELVNLLRDDGFSFVEGIDPYGEDSFFNKTSYMRKIPICALNGKFDVIMFHHVFEHLSDPESVLEKIVQLLAPSGICIIRTPVANKYAWHKYGVSWIQLDPPRHLFIPSVQGMENLVKRKGMMIKDIRFDSTDFQFWGSEQAKMGVPLMSEKSYIHNPLVYLLKRLSYQRFKKKARELNQVSEGDQAIFEICLDC